MFDLSEYNQIKHLLHPGDGVAFWGARINPISGLIEDLTGGGPSHWATVSQAIHANGPVDVEIFQSTIENGKNGAQRTPLAVELAGCEFATAFPLAASVRARMNLQEFYAAIGRWDGSVRYDVWGLFDMLLPDVANQGKRENVMFCSALGCALYEACGVVTPGLNWSKTTPAAMCNLGIYSTEIALVGHRGIAGFMSCDS
jgi:hypothetical protein